MVSCNWTNFGCNGGNLAFAWKYLTNTGIVSDACMPYVSGAGQVPACPTTCSNGQAFTKYKCASVVSSGSVSEIQSSIMTQGPMETGFTVYEDFMNYKSGIYRHVTGKQLGGHAVKIVGWGHDATSGEDYWICANSWNTSWGMNGFFNILMGDCGIDRAVYGCTVSTKTTPLF